MAAPPQVRGIAVASAGQDADMDPGEQASILTLGCALAVFIGLVGIVVPALPGLLLCWGAVAVWAFVVADGAVRWGVLLAATLLLAAGTVVKYAVPGRNLKAAGVPTRSLLAGTLAGIVGFFVVPIVGMVIGFVLGVWLAEWVRQHDTGGAWASTKHALKATGLSMLIELAAGFGILAVLGAGVLLA
jgi:uncharacterized protein YqgC (DUF456 family)